MGIDAEMFFRLDRKLRHELVQDLSWRMGGAFGSEHFYSGGEGDEGLYIEEREEIQQDGPVIRPKEDEHFYRVLLFGRYYGPGYERGDCPLIVMLAAWIEANVEGAEVWYGGDSSGVCASRFGPEEREALLRHFYEHGRLPYLAYRNTGKEGRMLPRCPRCDKAMIHSGGGRNREFWFCYGCDKRVVTAPGVQRWLKREEDFFKVSEVIQGVR